MIEHETRGEVSVVRMVHGKANAFDLEFLVALDEALATVEAGAGRAVVITGRGSIFSAGVDLPRVLREGREYLQRFLPALDAVCLRLYGCSKPVVAAINGHAIAGGCVLSCAADRRVLARGASVGVPELKVGVPFPLPPLELVRASLAPAAAQEVIYLGRYYKDEAAVAVGLADELIEADGVFERAIGVAQELAKLPAAAFALNKRWMRGALLERLRRELPVAAREALELWSSDEAQAAIRSYVQATLKK